VQPGNVIGIVSAKLDAGAALAASGALPENVNYAVKSSLLLSFLKSVPAVSANFKAPVTADRKFEDVVKSAQDASVLVLVYLNGRVGALRRPDAAARRPNLVAAEVSSLIIPVRSLSELTFAAMMKSKPFHPFSMHA
jgi:hypothetical protein